MRKTTKIWLNYVAGGCISLFLLWNIYSQVTKQLSGIGAAAWLQAGPAGYLWLCVGLMFANTSLEGYKWHLLARQVVPMGYRRAFCSYLAGMAFSIVTPNRIGEYPGRILYLGGGNTFGFINVSVLGVMSQLSGVYIFGFAGLVYYNIAFPALLPKVALLCCLAANVAIGIVYWRFEAWMPLFERVRWLRRFSVYGRLLSRVTTRLQVKVLCLSLLRFAIFTAQYLFLLKWMNVDVPLAAGFCMAGLFFWVMAVIPGISLTELGIRGTVSTHLFQHFAPASPNTLGILAATAGIWLLNLVLPSILGSLLILRMRLLR